MPRALIFGTGSVGCVYGYILYQAGVEVTAVCRSNFNAVKSAGISIKSKKWGNVSYQPNVVRTISEAYDSGPFDYLFVCSKAFPGGAFLIKEAVTSQCAIVIAQNGIGIEDEYEQLYPNNIIIAGVVWLPATQVHPGVIEVGDLEKLELGTSSPHSSKTQKNRVKELSKIWQAGGGNALVFDDIRPQRWNKLAINCAFNSMAALTQCSSPNLVLSSGIAEDIILKVSAEVRAIASAEGIPLVSIDEIRNLIDWQRHRTRGKDPSMLLDVKAGRAMEVEAILGNTVRIAGKHGLDTPRLEMLYFMANALNASITKPEWWVETVE